MSYTGKTQSACIRQAVDATVADPNYIGETVPKYRRRSEWYAWFWGFMLRVGCAHEWTRVKGGWQLDVY